MGYIILMDFLNTKPNLQYLLHILWKKKKDLDYCAIWTDLFLCQHGFVHAH